jgi:hypothetical protein
MFLGAKRLPSLKGGKNSDRIWQCEYTTGHNDSCETKSDSRQSLEYSDTVMGVERERKGLHEAVDCVRKQLQAALEEGADAADDALPSNNATVHDNQTQASDMGEAPMCSQQQPCNSEDDYQLHELHAAAVRIQSAFRGHCVRKQLQEIADGADVALPSNDDIVDDNQTQAGGPGETPMCSHDMAEASKRSQAEQQPCESEDDQQPAEITINHAELHAAAVRIQSAFRGHCVRKQLQENAVAADVALPSNDDIVHDNHPQLGDTRGQDRL